MNIQLERIAYWRRCTVDWLLVSKQFCQVQYSVAKYEKKNYTGIGGNNMAKFIMYQLLANILILKFKLLVIFY